MSSLHRRAFLQFRSFAFNAPRRPRHPLLRIALGLLGVALLLALVVVGVFVGAAMLAGGMLWRLWKQRGKPIAGTRRRTIEGHVLEGTYRSVGKTGLPLAH